MRSNPPAMRALPAFPNLRKAPAAEISSPLFLKVSSARKSPQSLSLKSIADALRPLRIKIASRKATACSKRFCGAANSSQNNATPKPGSICSVSLRTIARHDAPNERSARLTLMINENGSSSRARSCSSGFVMPPSRRQIATIPIFSPARHLISSDAMKFSRVFPIPVVPGVSGRERIVRAGQFVASSRHAQPLPYSVSASGPGIAPCPATRYASARPGDAGLKFGSLSMAWLKLSIDCAPLIRVLVKEVTPFRWHHAPPQWRRA